jgi:hypothetical protein
MALLFPLSASAAEVGSGVDLGLNFFPTPSPGTISQMGYFARFWVGPKNKLIHPRFGGQVEANFGTNRLLVGFMQIGAELQPPNARVIKPFICVNGQLGWANYVVTTTSYVGLVYGFNLDAGMQLQFGSGESSTGIRITTGYRMLLGTIGGGLNASDLTSYQLSLGFTF